MSASPKTQNLTEQWTLVLPRRRKIRTPSATNPPSQQPVSWSPTDSQIDSLRHSRLEQKMQNSIDKLHNSQFFVAFLAQIQNPESDLADLISRVLGSETEMPMVIYGIGSIESYENPRLQLSLALLLKRNLSWIGSIEVFDPILSLAEARVMESLGCSVLSVNEQGRRKTKKPTLFFMPHCEAELYDNLLRENWSVELLKNVVILGNSFGNYRQQVSIVKNSVVSSSRYVLSVGEITDEFRIETVSEDYFGAFHDSSWHFFRPGGDNWLPLVMGLDF